MIKNGRASAKEGLKTAAVVVPLPHGNQPSADEQISLKHLRHFLGGYDKYLVAPEGFDAGHYSGLEVKRFDPKFFGSVRAYANLMLSEDFYEAFGDYEFILLHHTDAIVFSDQLREWCEAGVDYIGPPWFKCDELPMVETPRVGNGGFSLRNVQGCLKALRSRRLFVDPDEWWEEFRQGKPAHVQVMNLPKKYLKRFSRFNGVRRELHWKMKEDFYGDDHFFSDSAVNYNPDFKVASVEQGFRFAFDYAPRKSFELTNHTLPFGAHSWYKRDRAFWEPYLLK